jgi:predicted dehydrogenase
MQKKRYALVGAGSRARMFIDALVNSYSDVAELVALCDLSQTRMDWHNQWIQSHAGLSPIPTYLADQFDIMLAETHPDIVIVTTIDSTHHLYIIKAMDQGYDVITEKPMTIDLEKMKAIMQTVERTGKSLRVTFNARYGPANTLVRKLIVQGVIGKPLAVNYSWTLDGSHGADYFRRWHREKQYSGGLLVHKATHQFDLVNWWIDSYPQDVFAMGALQFYGQKNAEERGEHYSYDRYTNAPAGANDPFALNLNANKELRGLYLAAEEETGYIRDRNVFGGPITIEDTMNVLVRYRSGVLLTYSLIAYGPWEGLHLAITGTKGRIEMDVMESVPVVQEGKEHLVNAINETDRRIRVYPLFGMPYDVEIEQVRGGHGGADSLLLEDLFAPSTIPDSLLRTASHIDGAASILVGIAANESMRTTKMISVDDFFLLLNKEST